MKRFLYFVLILTIVLNSTLVFASEDMEAKLKDHWSSGIIEKDFLAYYFPYLAKNNFEKLNPDENIMKKDFALSLGSLAKDYKIEATVNGMVSDASLKRIDIANIVGEKLSSIEINYNNKDLPFIDIASIDKASRESIELLYNTNIISGVSKNRFAPDKSVSKAEAIVILQRVKTLLDDIKEIPYEIKGMVQSYNSQENIIVREKDKTVLVTITKEFPTPGYSLGIDKIVRENSNYKISLDIVPPSSDAILPQVITYKTITIEINKADLKVGPPYNFIVNGLKAI